jgi:hypothetical protein
MITAGLLPGGGVLLPGTKQPGEGLAQGFKRHGGRDAHLSPG